MPGPQELDDTDPLADYEPGGESPGPAMDSGDVDPLADYDPSSEHGTPDLVAQAQQETGDLGDLAMGGIDGLLMNYGDEIGSVGEGIGNFFAPRNPDAQYADDGSLHMFDDAKKTTMGKVGNVAGNVAAGVGVGLATGGLGGIGTQAAIGATQGAVSGYGQNHDPLEALLSAGIGGAFAGGGRALAGKLAPKASMLDDVAPRVHAPAAEYPQVLVPGELQSSAGGELPKMVSASKAAMASPADNVLESVPTGPWMEGPDAARVLSQQEMGMIRQLGSKAAAAAGGNPLKNPVRWGASKLVSKLLQEPGKMGSMAKPDPAAVRAMMAGAEGAGQLFGSGRATGSAQTTARPDVPTLTWAMQSVNAAGDTGLPDDAQQRLDEALMSGDDNKVSSVYMQYSLKYPAFQKRLQSELESINEGN